MKRRILSMATALALILALLPAAVVPAGAVTYTVGSSEAFHAALAKAQTGDTIQVSGIIVVKNSVSNNDSLVIDKAVTIQGGGVTLWYAGILLGADVTFQDITLGLASNARNAIMANGHTLTLDNVKKASGTRDIHLFCGGLTGGAGTQGALSDSIQGGHGQIILKGNTDLGNANIYAGSISADGGANVFAKPATVTVEGMDRNAGIGHIYACGALETPTSEKDWFDIDNEIAPPTAAPGNYPATGGVSLHLYGSAVKAVHGDTGWDSPAAVTYYDGGSGYLTDGLVLEHIGGLEVQSGSLTPAPGSSLAGDASLTVGRGATLGLNNLGDEVSISSFTGGGNLVLGAGQKLSVSGSVSETTTVGICRIFNGHSQSTPDTNGHVYIDAPNSKTDSFTLAAPAGRPDFILERAGDGTWTAVKDDQVTVVTDFVLPSKVADPSDEVTSDPNNPGQELILWSTSLPFESIAYASDPGSSAMAYVPLLITVNGHAATDVDGGNKYICTEENVILVAAGDSGDEDLQVETIDSTALTGPYRIEVTVPPSNSGTGQAITRTATLTIKAAAGDTPIPVPVANQGLVYNDSQQTGVPEGPGYTLTGHTNSAAGSYFATATPEAGFTWADGTTGEKTIPWTIALAEGPAAPTGLSAAAPSTYSGSDGKITGTDKTMEYSTDANFSGTPTLCADTETTVPAPGDYYVRCQTDANHEPGAAVLVTVPHGPITVTSIKISSTGHKTAYKVGDALDVAELTLAVTMSNGQTYSIPVAAGMVSGFDASAPAASQTLTVTYGGKEATYKITITQAVPDEGGGSTDPDEGGGSTDPNEGGGSTSGGTTSGGSSSASSTTSSTTTNPDGSVSTTVTDRRTGTVTTTTRNTDGSTTVVETKKDGTVTITDTAKSGVKVEAVSKPEADTTARVTIPTSVKTAAVTIPVEASPGMVAVDAKTGEVVKLSVPTEGGMAVKLDGSAELILVDRSKAFTDTEGHWAKDEIDFATAHAMFNGTSATTFSPNDAMTRGMLAVVLHNFEDNPEFTTQNSFSDVDPGAWYADGINWMIDRGIAGGYGDGSFGANDSLTREQLVTFLYRYANSMGYSTAARAGLSGFADGDSVSGYATEAMRWAVGSGLVVGSDGALDPQGSATRAQTAAILKRFVVNLTR